MRIKADVVAKYGGACKCCGETKVAFLTVDHINNDGTALRKAGVHGGGGGFYKKLLRMAMDPTLQILCWNCNMGRKITGMCPHQDNAFHQEALRHPRWTRRSTVQAARPSMAHKQFEVPCDHNWGRPDADAYYEQPCLNAGCTATRPRHPR